MLPEATGTGRVLFTDSGFMPVLEKNIVELGPEQMVVVGYGKFSTREYDLGIEKDIVIPATIQKYVTTNYPDAKILKIERDKKDYEVKLSNRTELKFDLKFNLIDIDF